MWCKSTHRRAEEQELYVQEEVHDAELRKKEIKLMEVPHTQEPHDLVVN